MESNFTEEDKKRLLEFFNIIAEKAQFNLNTQEVIKYFGLLSFVQNELIPKIDSNILEITNVVDEKPVENKSKAKAKK